LGLSRIFTIALQSGVEERERVGSSTDNVPINQYGCRSKHTNFFAKKGYDLSGVCLFAVKIAS